MMEPDFEKVIDSTDDDWRNLKDAQHDPIPELSTQDAVSVKFDLMKRKGRVYFLAWCAALVLFIVMMFPRYGISSFGYLITIPLFPVGFPAIFSEYLSDDSAGVLIVIAYVFYVLHALVYAFSRNKTLVRWLLVLLAVVLLINVRGCCILAEGISGIH